MIEDAKYYERLDIQQIREFLLHGSELPYIEKGNFDERIRDAQGKLNKFLDKKFPDFKEHEKILQNISDCGLAMKEIYFEMGMKSGACLIVQLLADNIAGNFPKT